MPTLSLASFTRFKPADLISRISTGARNAQGVEVEGNDISDRRRHQPRWPLCGVRNPASNLAIGSIVGHPEPCILHKDLQTGAGGPSGLLQVAAHGSHRDLDPQSVRMATRSVRGDGAGLPGGSSGVTDLFLRDLQTGTLRRVSAEARDAQGNEAGGNQSSTEGSFSADGRYVVFSSYASNLAGPDSLGSDVFRKDLQTGALLRVSLTSGGQAPNGESSEPIVSADGRYVVFTSAADNLVAGDTNGEADIFRKDLQTGAIVQDLDRCQGPARTGGRSEQRVFQRIDQRRRTLRGVREAWPTISWQATPTAGPTSFARTCSDRRTVRVSTGRQTAQANGDSYDAHISPDGRYVVFDSVASNLTAAATAVRPRVSQGSADRRDRAHRRDGELRETGTAIIPSSRPTAVRSCSTATPPTWSRATATVRKTCFASTTISSSHRQAVAEGRYVKASFDVGQASSARISWGDGTSDAAVPAHGKVTFSHVYAAAGLKAATVTVVDGAQTWTVPHRIDVGALAMSRDTGLRDTLSGAAGHDVLSGDGFGNALAGGGGADTLRGEAGHDVLGGGAGRDKLYGLKGAASRDAFLFDTKLTSKGVANQHKDQILDFGPKFDAIWFDDAAFTNRTIAKYLKGKMFSLDAPMKMKAGFLQGRTRRSTRTTSSSTTPGRRRCTGTWTAPARRRWWRSPRSSCRRARAPPLPTRTSSSSEASCDGPPPPVGRRWRWGCERGTGSGWRRHPHPGPPHKGEGIIARSGQRAAPHPPG